MATVATPTNMTELQFCKHTQKSSVQLFRVGEGTDRDGTAYHARGRQVDGADGEEGGHGRRDDVGDGEHLQRLCVVSFGPRGKIKSKRHQEQELTLHGIANLPNENRAGGNGCPLIRLISTHEMLSA